MKADITYIDFKQGSDELIAKLVEDHAGWATAIAKSVARSWNMDWQLDGLDGGAYEGLLFCAGRFDPTIGVPFRAYARRRIHQSTTEEARKSKTWQRNTGNNSEMEQESREISATLFEIFPELREGVLPAADDSTEEETVRSSVRQLLTGATLVAAFKESVHDPERAVEYRRLLEAIAELELIHQEILHSLYWRGVSMRGLADEWGIDELGIVREHKEIVAYLSSSLGETAVGSQKKKPKIRRGLKPVAIKLKQSKVEPKFERFLESVSAASILLWVEQIYEAISQMI